MSNFQNKALSFTKHKSNIVAHNIISPLIFSLSHTIPLCHLRAHKSIWWWLRGVGRVGCLVGVKTYFSVQLKI